VRTFEIDVEDDDAYAAWFAPVLAADRFFGPDMAVWEAIELRALARSSEARHVLTAVADDDGTVVGAAFTSLWERENLDTAELTVLCVEPSARRRGFGRALLGAVLDRVVREGRTTVVVPIEEALDGPTPGEDFARAHGFTQALASAKRRIALPGDPELLDRLERAATPHAEDYELVTWAGRCPERWLPGRQVLQAGMSTDTPHGELEVEPATWDAGRVREFEDVVEAMQRDLYSSGAVHRESGELVAFSDVAISRITPTEGYQYDTIVLGAHRGHRLGILVKIANLRAVAAASPATTTLQTWNADDNAPMIGVNEALGFTVAARGGLWQRHLDAPAAPLVATGPVPSDG
jgi:GNAT superfamily N-acetyltransferase